MKACRECGGAVPRDATACPECGADLPAPSRTVLTEPGPDELKRLAEIRRLQRIASGIPGREDKMRRAKGIMAFLIMVMILVYVYIWKESRSAEMSGGAALTYTVFNAAFGPGSPLSDGEKDEEFQHYRGLRVVWSGDVVYVNRGTRKDLYASIRHRGASPTADVLLRFRESNRAELDGLPVGTKVRYSGRLHDYGEGGSGFLTLTEGRILERLDEDSLPSR